MTKRGRLGWLAATSAAAALTLSGCGLFGGDDSTEEDSPSPSTEASQEQSSEQTASPDQTSSSEPTETSTGATSATPTASASGTAQATGGGDAPTDLSNNSVMGALNGQTVGGATLNALPVSLMESSGYDIPALLEENLGVVTVDPATCDDPVQGSFMGGIVQSNMADSVVAVDTEGTVIVTVHSYGSVEEAETELENWQTGVEDCAQATMSLDGSALAVELSDEEITVDGAESATRTTMNAAGPGGDMDVHTARMVYGNSLVTIVASEEYEGVEADYEALLTEVADYLASA